MKRQDIHRRISELLQHLTSLHEGMEAQSGKIPAVELDVFRKNAIDLYDQLNQLTVANYKSAESVVNTVKEEVTITVEKQVIPEPQPVVEKQPEPVAEIKPEIKEEPVQEEPIAEPVAEVVNTVVEPEIMAEPVVMEKVEIKVTREQPTVTGEGFVSVNEKLSAPGHVVDKLKLLPVADIKEAMSTSQRFQYIVNLFGDDFELFTHTVNYINQAPNQKEALEFISINIEKKYKWTDENPLVNEFKTLVYRRFVNS